MPPLIVPVTPPSATPPATPDPGPAAADAAAQPRFADALSRAGAPAETGGGGTGSVPSSATSKDRPGDAGAARRASPAGAATTDGAARQAVDRGMPPGAGAVDRHAPPASDAVTQLADAIAPLPPAAMPSGKILPQGPDKPEARRNGSAESSADAEQPSGPLQALAMLLAPAAAGVAATPAVATPAAAAAAPASPDLAQPGKVELAAGRAGMAKPPLGEAAAETGLPLRPAAADAPASVPSTLFARRHEAAMSTLESASKGDASDRVDASAPTTSQPALPGGPVMQPTSAAVAPGVPATASPAQGATVHLPVGSPGWGQAIGQQVLFAVQGQQQVATLHLNPPQLGPLAVHLQVQDGQVQAQFVSPHAVVRQAVEAALPQLRDMFGSAGLSLLQTSVGTQGGQGGRQGWWGRSAPGSAATAAIGSASAVEAPPASVLQWRQGLVNTYV